MNVLNRRARRKLEKENKNCKSEIMEKYRNDVWEAGRKAGMLDASEIMFYMMAYTINYKLGFGRKRLQRIMKDICFEIECFTSGHLKPNDRINFFSVS